MSIQQSGKKICVVGGGAWGENHIRVLFKMGNLGGIVEKNTERIKELIEKYPSAEGHTCFEEAICKSYDGFIVATPSETHFSLGSALLKQKQNVLIEKPLSLCSVDSYKLVKIAEENSAKLMVGHLLVFHPAIKKIKEMIEEGKIGSLLYLYSNRLNLGRVRTKENVIWSFAPHDISVFDYIIGKPPLSVKAAGGCFLQEGIYDVAVAGYSYPDNIKAHIYVSWLHPVKEQKLVIIGSKGMISFEDSSPEKQILFYDSGIELFNGEPVKREHYAEIIPYEPSSPLENEINFFIEHLDSEITIADGKKGHEVVRILEKTVECLQTGNTSEMEVDM